MTHPIGIARYVVLNNEFQSRVSGGTGQGIASKCGPMFPNLENVRFALGHNHADGHPAGQSLGQSHNIRFNAVLLVAEKRSYPPYAGLDFIQYEEYALQVKHVSYLYQI